MVRRMKRVAGRQRRAVHASAHARGRGGLGACRRGGGGGGCSGVSSLGRRGVGVCVGLGRGGWRSHDACPVDTGHSAVAPVKALPGHALMMAVAAVARWRGGGLAEAVALGGGLACLSWIFMLLAV